MAEDPMDRLVRATGSSLIFGVTLLYTMEVWWVGMALPTWKVGVFLGATFLLNLFLGRFGFSDENKWRPVVFEAFEALAVGAVAATVCMYGLGVLQPGDAWGESASQLLMMTIPFMMGAFLADKILPFLGSRRSGDGSWPKETLQDAAATIAGGIFLALPITPTDEIPMLAIRATFWNELALVALGLLAGYIIVFATREGEPRETETPLLNTAWAETVFCYAVSLLAAGGFLVLFGQIDWSIPTAHAVSQAIILAFPMTVGGAAGRLAI